MQAPYGFPISQAFSLTHARALYTVFTLHWPAWNHYTNKMSPTFVMRLNRPIWPC